MDPEPKILNKVNTKYSGLTDPLYLSTLDMSLSSIDDDTYDILKPLYTTLTHKIYNTFT